MTKMISTYYFQHDYNSRNNFKIRVMFKKYGLEAYGLYWCIIEDLYNNANALPLDYECLAYDYRSKPDLVKSLINDFGLFETNDTIFWSVEVQEKLLYREEKSRKAREKVNIRWDKLKNNTEVLQVENNGNTNVLPKEIDGNTRKGKDTTGKDTRR